MKKICKNCEFYKKPIQDINIKDDCGVCENNKFVKGWELKYYPLNDKLNYWDEESLAGFHIGHKFGCIHWESKDPPVPDELYEQQRDDKATEDDIKYGGLKEKGGQHGK